MDGKLRTLTACSEVPLRKLLYTDWNRNWISDFNGDGIDDILRNGLDLYTSCKNSRTSSKTDAMVDVADHQTIYAKMVVPGGIKSRFIGYADMNADSVTDLIFYSGRADKDDSLIIYQSTGNGFRQFVEVFLPFDFEDSSSEGRYLFTKIANAQDSLTDLNADGLTDILVHPGFVSPEWGGKSAWRC